MSSASAPGLPGSWKSAARMFDVTGLIVQSAGALSVNGPIASVPSACFSSALGGVFCGTEPGDALVLSPGWAAWGLGGAAWGLGGATPVAGGLAEPQSLAGGRSPLGGCFLQDIASAATITRA